MKLKLNFKPISSTKKYMCHLTTVDIVGIFLLSLYVLASFASIMQFPVIHSDELWLNGIASEMALQKSLAITEPFYDLYPRTIHPFRWLYNGLIILVRPVLGSSIRSIRTLSFIFAITSLILLYKILKVSIKNEILPLIGSILLAINIQFIYSSHQGRQEMILVFFMLLGLFFLTRPGTSKLSLKLSFILFLAMGIHPNSFLLGVAFTATLFIQGLLAPSSFKRYLVIILRLAIFTCIGVITYLIVGFSMNPNFITEYINYGTTLGIDQALTGRFQGFYWFFYKLYQQIGGTYDLFNIKIQLLTLALIIIIGTPIIIGMKIKKIHLNSSSSVLFANAFGANIGLLLGLLIIGRYNQTSIIFFIPVLILSLAATVGYFLQKTTSKVTSSILLATSLIFVLLNANQLWNNLQSYDRQHFYTVSYDTMIETLQKNIPSDATVLGNLNTIEAFQSQKFYDIRNLGYLDTTIENYLETRAIDYIVIHEEMDYIWRTSPKWDFLYVNLDYYPALKSYLQANATLVKTFDNPIYAMRIARYSGTYPWTTTIYKLER